MRYPLILSLLALAACAPKNKEAPVLTPDVAAVVGTWTAPRGTWSAGAGAGESNVLERSMTIHDDGVTVETICRVGGDTVIARATAPAIVTEKTITVLRSSEHFRAAGSELCRARLDQGVLAYEIIEGSLVLKPAAGAAYVFGRKDELKPAESKSEGKLMEFLNQGAAALGES